MSIEKAASMPVALKEIECDEAEGISDEDILAEMVKYEPHELVVRMPPKRSRIVRARRVIRVKAKPRPIEPDEYDV